MSTVSKCRILVRAGLGARAPKTFPFSPEGMRKAANIANGFARSPRAQRSGSVTIAVACGQTKWSQAYSAPGGRGVIALGHCTPSGCKFGGGSFAEPSWVRKQDARRGRASKAMRASLAGTRK